MGSPADIVIGGGAAGSGKTFALLMEFLRHKNVENWGGVIFRRTMPQIKSEGGLWDTSTTLYPFAGGSPKGSTSEWIFKNSKLKFSHLEYEKDILNWQGSQIPFIGFDEVTHFTKKQFFYLLSRNRSSCGVKPYVRCTCNPDPDSWVAEFIKWFIGEDGFPTKERCGKLRYFIMYQDNYIWGNTKQEVIDQVPDIASIAKANDVDVNDLVKSMTFIPGSIYHNKKLLEVNPEYLANLMAQDEALRAQLLDGNWKVRVDGLGLFDYYKCNDLFSNYADPGKKYITCDASRFGRDYTVVLVWSGWQVVKTIVYFKTEAYDIVNIIEAERKRFIIPKSNVLVDQDGVGDSTVKLGGYQGFHGGAQPMKDPETRIKENYKNLKTQCYYRASKKVNEGSALWTITPETVEINGIRGTKIKKGSEVVDIRDLIKADLRAIKRDKVDMDGKMQINSKEEQKAILNGRSPDFGDPFMMREWFDLRLEYNLGSTPANY
ncbi:MAG TPA: terminase family protein [Bacteroidia bacterium]